MELYDEEKVTQKNNKNQYLKMGLVVAVILLFMLIVVALVLPKGNQVVTQVIKIDGTSKQMPTNFYLTGENNTIYISIEEVAKLLGYSYLRGEYIDRYTEDVSKCYVEGEEEVCSYIAGSNTIYKCTPNSTGEYEYYYIKDNIVSYENRLYSNIEGIQIGFNVQVQYDQTGFTIRTVQNILDSSKEMITKKFTNTVIDETKFQNKKALLKGFIVFNTNGKYGVLNMNGETIIGAKYDSITYSENTNEFYVKSENKSGVLSTTGETKIGLNYDEITLLNNDLRLYYVKRGNKCGVLDRNGRIVIHIEYDAIGIDSSLYPKNQIKNQRLLYDNCIPVKQGQKWGFYNKHGELIVPIEYDNIGFVVSTSNEKSMNNVVIIEDIDGIVVGKEKKYGVVNSTGEIIIPCEFDRIYSVTSGGEDIYYLEKDGQTIYLDDYIVENNLKSYKNNTLVKPEENTNTEQNTTNETNSVENQTQNIVENV